MTPAIYVVGAQCSGKTTLAMALEEYFSSNIPHPAAALLTEAARGVLQRHNFTRNDIRESRDRCMELQKLILEAQWAEEKKIEQHSMLISDRSGIDPIIYAAKYGHDAGTKLLLASPAWQELRDRMSRSIVIVCEPVQDWLRDDGVRLMPTDSREWAEVHQSFCSHLDYANIRYSVLPSNITSLTQRVDFVAELWRKKPKGLMNEDEMKSGNPDPMEPPLERH